jgi:hypothetical protein
MAKTKTLNIRLLRKGRTVEKAFIDTFAPGAERALQQRPWNDIEGASLYIGQIYSNPPGWTGFLQQGSADIPTDLFTSGAGAVIGATRPSSDARSSNPGCGHFPEASSSQQG